MRAPLKIYILFLTIKYVSATICSYNDSVELTNRTHNGIKYENGEYFVDNVTGIERGCVCMKQACIRKCCPLGQGYDYKKKMCVDIPNDFQPPVAGFEMKRRFNGTEEFHILFRKPNCTKANEIMWIVKSSTKQFHLNTDGRLYVPTINNISPYLIYGPDKYCIDNFVMENINGVKSIKLNSYVCYKTKKDRAPSYITAICMLISCFFIILTITVYASLPKLRTLHGMVMTMYLLSFFVGFIFMATMQILVRQNNIYRIWCTSMTFIIYFSFLSAFFWLNVMCYDLWSKFRTIKVTKGVPDSKHKKFLMYCLYAFGIPALMTALLAILEFADFPKNIQYLPRLRLGGCFLYQKSKLIYLYAPMMVICLANLMFFALTARSIANTVTQTRVLKRKDTRRFWLYVKLFIVTGISWVLEVVSYFWPEIILWHLTDAYNTLVGVIIFIIFVCKKSILMSIKQRYNELMDKRSIRSNSKTTTTSLLVSQRASNKTDAVKTIP